MNSYNTVMLVCMTVLSVFFCIYLKLRSRWKRFSTLKFKYIAHNVNHTKSLKQNIYVIVLKNKNFSHEVQDSTFRKQLKRNIRLGGFLIFFKNNRFILRFSIGSIYIRPKSVTYRTTELFKQAVFMLFRLSFTRVIVF